MLFLAWLAVSFVIVVAVNLYLRYFGLPRRPLTTTTTTADGRVIASTGTVSYGPGSGSTYGSTGFASGFQGLFGGLTGGTGITAGASAAGVHGGETGRWVNSVLSWIYSRAQSGAARPEILDAWIKALSDEADQQSRDIRVRFDDVRGTLPEFSNFSVGPSTVAVGGGQTAATSGGLTVYTTVTAKDITLQMCLLTQTAVANRTIYSDVYLLHLHGQLKVVITPNVNTSDTPIHISFVSAPDIRLQILPTGRLDTPIDVASIEQVVRVALANTTTKLFWSSSGGIRSAYVPAQMQQQPGLRTVQPVNQQNAYGANFPSQQGFNVNQSTTGYNSPSISGPQQFQQPAGLIQQQQQQLQQLQPLSTQQQQQQQYMQPHQQQQNQYSSSPSGDLMRPFDMNSQNTFTTGNLSARRLLVKVIKANGLGDNDIGSCNAYCVIRVDRPPQNYMTSVARNTVNPMWDESFVVDTDSNTRQIQLDVLDRDKPPETELLGKTSIQMDEIRRLPISSRQILPLTGRPRSRTATSGSVTVEFAIMDANDTSRLPVVENVSAVHTNQLQSMPLGASQYNDGTAGQFGGYQSRLNAHDMALSQQQTGIRPQDSPSLVVTGSELHRMNPQYQAVGTLDNRGRAGQEKKESFASALKKRLSRGTGKKRSQSAERNQLHSQSLHDPYLRPPGDNMAGNRGTDMTGGAMTPTGERKVRSNSFSSSLRRIFKPSSSSASDGGKSNISREGSLTRTGGVPAGVSGDAHFQQQQQYQLQQQQQQQMGYGSNSGFDRSLRQSTPVPPDRRGMVDVQFSGSMSATSPVQHQPHSVGLNATAGGRY